MKRLWIALGAYASAGGLWRATSRIDDQKFKLATLAILAMFAVRTLVVEPEACSTNEETVEEEQRNDE